VSQWEERIIIQLFFDKKILGARHDMHADTLTCISVIMTISVHALP